MPARRCRVRSRTSSRSGPCHRERRRRRHACAHQDVEGPAVDLAQVHAAQRRSMRAALQESVARQPSSWPIPSRRRDAGASAAAPGRRFIGHHQNPPSGSGRRWPAAPALPRPPRSRTGTLRSGWPGVTVAGDSTGAAGTARPTEPRPAREGTRAEGLGARGQGGRESRAAAAARLRHGRAREFLAVAAGRCEREHARYLVALRPGRSVPVELRGRLRTRRPKSSSEPWPPSFSGGRAPHRRAGALPGVLDGGGRTGFSATTGLIVGADEIIGGEASQCTWASIWGRPR